jgi:TP901 family phage tail tape measure protein
MASKFVLTAQLQLQAPTNTAQIVNLVNKQLQGVQMNVNPVVNAKSLNQANQAIQKVGVSAKVASKSLNSAAGSAGSLGTALGAAARRFASITLATGFFLALTRAVGSAVGRAIDFEKEMLKISQVTGKSIRSLRDLSSEVTRLSTTLGVSSEELLNAARTLSQAGFAAEKVTGALKILAQTDLAATFDNIADTTEGAIAILSQFRSEVRAAGGEVQFLEKAMDSINSVSKSFAVESSDLISVVRRTGGVFEAAGGKLNELIALFTSVRATTRETADTIATGFRTIFTRIQRSETIDSLKELGIVLQDTEGKFVGPMEAIARLSSGLKALDPRDFRFNEIVEQLGGFRQIGKVIPLIKQYSTSTAALAIANNSMGSTAADAAIAQQGLGNQFAKLREQFDATIRSIASSDTFQTLATSAIKLAESILKIVESLEPLLPMLTALAAFKLGSIALPALGKFAGVGGRHEGGKIHAFAGGGMVPGKGNRDTVPAVLTPGEFVMRKSAVKKIGANNMADMNNGYAAGGTVTARRNNYGLLETVAAQGNDANTQSQRRMNKKTTGDADGEVDKFLFSAPATTAVAYTAGANAGPQAITGPLAMQAAGNLKEKLAINAAAIPGNVKNAIGMEDIIDLKFPYFASKASKPLQEVGTEKKIQTELEASVTKMSTDIANKLDFDIPPAIATDEQSAAAKALKKIDTKTISGYIFEAVVSTLTSVGTDAGAGFDYINTADAIPRFNKIFGPDIPANTQAIEAKRTKSSGSIRGKGNSLLAKIAASAMPGSPSNVQGKLGVTLNKVSGKERGGKIQGFAAGGKPTGTDTVPAMLTPGEYVVKKSAAQSIGYSNLHRMNQSNGVNGYAAGGIVGSTRNNYGVMPGGAGGSGGAGINMGPVNSSMMA